MPSRIFFTSASVASKIDWTFAVTSARFCSSFDLVLPLSATTFARAAPLAPCMPATPSLVSAAASALPCSMTCSSCFRYSPGAVSAWAAASFLSATRLLELGLARLRELLLADLAVRHLLVDLVLAGLEVDLLRRRRLGDRARGGDRHD